MDSPLIMEMDLSHLPGIKYRRQPVASELIGIGFYLALTFLLLVASSVIIYAYLLQDRYKSEKFRCDTPFFHRRDDIQSASSEGGLENSDKREFY